MPLKYLFTAHYRDGSSYEQTPEDLSIKDPARSCFFDVDQDNLVSFILKGEGHEYGVDLRTGEFWVDTGSPFTMHEDPSLKDFRLIFFRRHTHHFRIGKNYQKELDHTITYRMGWQCTVDGKNYQQVMQFK